ncbi:MAG: DUF2281 domain-containing protein [Nostoc sp.]|uniref:DUF2281 domain-containing protein n=1 Tax=Nostoc sp. TaxID=1180 RepID=UPI001D6CAE70|nr:DUF2281 domain-containing protein [Nostoc sp. JL34]
MPNSKLAKKPILKDRGYELHCSVNIVAASMDSLKEKILKKLERLPDNAQQEVLDFVQFLEWRKENCQKSQLPVVSEELDEESDAGWLGTDLSNLGSYEPYDWQPGELDKGLPIKYVPGMGVMIVEE